MPRNAKAFRSGMLQMERRAFARRGLPESFRSAWSERRSGGPDYSSCPTDWYRNGTRNMPPLWCVLSTRSVTALAPGSR